MANTFLNKDGLSHLISKLKAYISTQISAHTGNKSNPHGVTKAQVGLGSVANLDQSKAIKSITRSGTTFTATALDGTTTTFNQQDSNTTYGSMSGASASAAGTSGLVPAPSAGAANRYLRSDGTWEVPPDTDTKYSAATSSSGGLMSAADKVALDSMKNLQVGGTNLLIGTSRYRKDTPYSTSSSIVDNYVLIFDGICIVSKQPLKAGEKISVQAKSNLPWSARHSGPVGTAGFWIYYGTLSELYAGSSHFYSFYPGDDQSTEFKKTVSVPSIKGIDDIYMMFRFNTYSDGSTPVTGKFWDLKVERGTIATDWSPAPEDYEATVKSFTFSASSWSSGSYKISDSLITASSNQEILPAVGITSAQYNALSKAQIVDGGQEAGSMTLKALGTVPTIDIPIRVVFRGTI